MPDEYITKQQAIDLVKSLEVLIGCTGISVLTREIKRMPCGVHVVEWNRTPYPCDTCKTKDLCCEADQSRCCKLCHYLGNDNRCDDCDPIEVEE